MSTKIIPDGQSFKKINISIGRDGSGGLTIDTSDPKLAEVKEDDPTTIKVLAYYRYTRIEIAPSDGNTFKSHSASEADRLQYNVDLDAGLITIDVHNTNHSKDAENGNVTLTVVDDQGTFLIRIETPAYQQMYVTFGDGLFSFGGDVVLGSNPPALEFTRAGAAYFILTGATFTSTPFIWDSVPPDDKCIIGEGEDGSHAIFVNLYTDKASHSFLFQVTSGCQTYTSKDPTIVNVDPDQP